jgi:hypothetical protein
MATTNGFVYLICDPQTDRFKIGVTKGTIDKRILELQTGNSNELHLTNCHETKYPFRMEKMLHAKYGQYRINGEWFNLPSEAVLKFNDTCDEIESTIDILKDNPFFIKNLRE